MIDAWLAGQAEAIVQQTEADGAVFDDSERRRLGADHAQVGGLILARWGLPETLRHAAQRAKELKLPAVAERPHGLSFSTQRC